MSELVPQPLAVLARRAIAEHARQQAVFDLPERKWYRGAADLDTSVVFHGERAATPLGPAAGPHSQLAQNIVLSWLGGGRVVELKTVQVKDDLVIPRPCIDAANVGYNVEWSQELAVPRSLEEYAKAWVLLHLLEAAGVTTQLARPRPETLFDLSVGYDLEGIQSPKVSGFIRGMMDASGVIASLLGELGGDLARYRDLEVPARISDCITLSTFHGCPAHEIEAICHYLLTEIGTHVIIKMNPTLLGFEEVSEILGRRLGFDEIVPLEEEFARDLKWDQALAMVARLRETAAARGLTLGAKFTNTLVVRNHKRFFPEEDRMYMSGPPLHPIAMSLALRFREAMGADLPISFTGGIDAHNFADAVASGLSPVTSCTDLLRPGGYGRMFKYLTGLEERMRKLGVADLPAFILAAEGAAAEGIEDPSQASLHNMRRITARVLEDPRYGKGKNTAVPRKIGSSLTLFDCISCDKCVPVCPNDANFVYTVKATSSFSEEAYVGADGALGRRTGLPYVVEREHQIGNYADFCNDCGNCDVFCPEDGGPYVEKPRFFGSLEKFRQDARHGGFYLEASPELVRVWARIGGQDYRLALERSSHKAVFDDGQLELRLDANSGLIESIASVDGKSPPQGHVLSTMPARTMLGIVDGLLDASRLNPINAALLG
jgi:putative selenate reductase